MWESSAVQTVTWMGCAILLMGMIFWMKAKFQRQARDNVRVEFIVPGGVGKMKLWKVEDGWIKVPAAFDSTDSKKNSKKTGRKVGEQGKSWKVTDASFYKVPYPENFPSFLQSMIDKVIIDTEKMEPISNLTGEKSLKPGMVAELQQEKALQIVAQQSKAIDERLSSLEKQTTPRGILIGFAIVILAIAIIGYYQYMNVPAMQETLDTIKAGMGL